MFPVDHRRGHAVLQTALPVKEEYVLFIRMSPIQRKLYNEFMSSIRDSGLTSWSNSNNPIKAFSVCCKVCIQSLTSPLNLFLVIIIIISSGLNAHRSPMSHLFLTR